VRLPSRIDAARLIIRPLRKDEEATFVAFMTDEETTTSFMFEAGQKTEAGARAFLAEIVSSYETDVPFFVCAISAREVDEFVGLCGLSPLAEANTFECFVCLSPRCRGRGYATESVAALIRYGFAEYPIDAFRVYIDPGNARSVALAERLRMRCLGPARHPMHGHASVVYSLDRHATREHRTRATDPVI